MGDRCKICHGELSPVHLHWGCALTKPIEIRRFAIKPANIYKLYYAESTTTPATASLTVVVDGLDRLPEKICAETRKERLAKCYQHIWNEFWLELHHWKSIEVEKVFKTWAILEMMPDEGIPCANLRPLDLIVDKESLFSSCEAMKFIGIDGKVPEKQSRDAVTIIPLYDGSEEEGETDGKGL